MNYGVRDEYLSVVLVENLHCNISICSYCMENFLAYNVIFLG